MLKSFMLILPIMICVLTGYAAKKMNLLNEESNAVMGKIVFYIAVPCILFRSLQKLKAAEFAEVNFLIAIHVAYLAMMLCAWAFASLRSGSRERRAASVLMALRSNNLFMGMPAALMVFGEAGLITYSRVLALMIVGFELMSVCGGLIVYHGGLRLKNLGTVARSLAGSPVVLGCAAGLAWNFCVGLPVPRWLDMSMSIFGNLGTGLALLSLGMKLTPETVLHDLAEVWPDALIRLVFSPLIMWLGFRLWPVPSEMASMMILIAAMPVAMNTLPMAQAMNLDADYTAKNITVCTVLSVVTIPAVISTML